MCHFKLPLSKALGGIEPAELRDENNKCNSRSKEEERTGKSSPLGEASAILCASENSTVPVDGGNSKVLLLSNWKTATFAQRRYIGMKRMV